MKNIWTIMKKEFARVFKDPKLLLSVVILPGLMIFLLYTIFGSAFSSINSSSSTVEKPYIIDTINMPQAVETAFDNIDGFYHEFIKIDDTSLDEEKEKVKNKDVQLILIYPVDFMDKVMIGEQSSLEMLYNPAETKSDACYKVAVSVMEAFKEAVQSPIFTVETTSIYDEQKTVSSYIAMMLPLLILTFLFQAAMSIGPESIAGEKERGTIATLLITPCKRSEIAIGKVLSLSGIAILSALSSFAGIILSLPKLIGLSNVSSINIYGVGDYFAIIAILISTVLLIIGLISNFSSYAKNIKEATLICSPIMIISMIIGMVIMIFPEAPTNSFLYLIPLFNSAEIMVEIFTFSFNWVHFVITICSNLIYTIVMVFILSFQFNSERIMYSK